MLHARNLQNPERDLEIVPWNANGLPSKLEELREFLDRIMPDILLINETQLTPSSRRVRLPNYTLYRNDKQAGNRPAKASGGTAIAVKTSIRHHCVTLPPLNLVEATAIELPGVLGGLLLVAAHVPPRPGLLVADLDAIFATHSKVILAGDLNCKHTDWGSRLITTSGRRLHGFVTSHHIRSIGQAQPTYYPFSHGARPDVLDIALVKGLVCPVQVISLSELSSDHCPIMVHAATQHTVGRNARPVVY